MPVGTVSRSETADDDDPNKRGIFGGVSLGPTADARMDVILFYGRTC